MPTVGRKQNPTEGWNPDKFRGDKSSSVTGLYSERYTAPVPAQAFLDSFCRHYSACIVFPETTLVRGRAVTEKTLEPVRQQIAGWDTKVRPSLTLRSEAESYVIAVEKGEVSGTEYQGGAEYQELMHAHAERIQAVIFCWPNRIPEPAD